VTLSITTPEGATLTCTSNPLAASSGVASFAGCKIDKAGTYTLTAKDGSLTSATSSSLTITVGTAASLTLGASSTTPGAGEADNLTITALDAGGNVATTYSGVHELTFSGASAIGSNNPTVSNSSGTATNFGTKTAISFSSGVATVKETTKNGVLRLYKAESAKVVVSDGTINNGTGLSITVSTGTASTMAFVNCSVGAENCSGQPISVGNNSDMTFNMQTQDSFGNPSAPTSALSITFTNSDGTFSITAGEPAKITAPATTSGSVTLHHGVNGGTNTLTAKASGFANVTLTAKK
ncbi:MAG TPA: hypothetical protein VLJ80_05595, partial [Solirubrobacteraceae bacterium]|nr:hypothetical protein [Solirubrobacteraceae bacterium]